MPVSNDVVLVSVDEIPWAHVARLFLNPVDGGAGSVSSERIGQCLAEWIVLFEPYDRDVGALAAFALGCKVVIDLPAAQQDSRGLRRVGRIVRDDPLKRTVRHLVERAH